MVLHLQKTRHQAVPHSLDHLRVNLLLPQICCCCRKHFRDACHPRMPPVILNSPLKPLSSIAMPFSFSLAHMAKTKGDMHTIASNRMTTPWSRHKLCKWLLVGMPAMDELLSNALRGAPHTEERLACMPIMGAATATRSSSAAVSQLCMPPSESPVMPILLASTSGRVLR